MIYSETHPAGAGAVGKVPRGFQHGQDRKKFGRGRDLAYAEGAHFDDFVAYAERTRSTPDEFPKTHSFG